MTESGKGRLAGKVALISGGARGIGAATAHLFAREGAAVIIGDVLDTEGVALENDLRASGHQATFVHLDVTQEADWHAAVKLAVDSYGRLDVLVNNAGIVLRAMLEEIDEAGWDQQMAVNAKGTLFGTQSVIPVMRAAGGGSIVNISSTAGLVGSTRPIAAYGASKGAVRMLTRFTAVQHAQDGIRCNSIYPGPIKTDMNRTVLDQKNWLERFRHLPLQRFGTVDDIAYGALYLASDESSYVTGIELPIDGGTCAG